MTAKIHNIEDHAEENKYKKLVTISKQIIEKEINAILGDIFDEADDLLFKDAEDAVHSSEQNALFDKMRQLRIERDQIKKSFVRKLHNRLAPKHLKQNTEFNSDELSLVSQDEMEEMVAISSISNRSDNLHAEAISHLQARIEHLDLKSRDNIDKEALLPKHFCEDFLASINHVELDTRTRLIFLKVFGKYIDLALEAIYSTINYRFIEAGILPSIKVSAPKQPSNRSNVNDNFYSFSSTEYETPDYSDQVSADQDYQKVIQNYILRNIPQNAVTQINDQNYYERSHVVDALSSIQQQYSQTTQPLNFDLIKRALLQNINSGSGGLITKQVNQVDEKTIDVIELLFKEILEDQNLTGAIKTIILRLQIPTIKVAMLDPQFFNNPQHPARNFLNLLSHVGIGITDDSDKLLAGIEVITDTLLNDYEQDSVSFQKAVDSLNKLIHREYDNCQKTEEKTQRTILREHARKIVLAELQRLARGNTIDKKNEPLILRLWPTQMYHVYLKHGKDSPQWDDSVDTLKQIIDSIQLPTTQRELAQLVNSQDDILHKVEARLTESGQDSKSINMAILALSETYLDHINHADIPDPEANSFANFAMDTFAGMFNDTTTLDHPVNAANALEEELPALDEEPSREADKREQLQLLPHEVKPGLWFELFDGEERPPRRLKLSVIIMEEAQLIFVNRQGMKIMEKNAAEFAEELEAELSKIIADHSVFDQALNNVISVLSKTA